MGIRIYKGKKINRILCLLFLCVSLVLLAAAGIAALGKRPELAGTFLILTGITGGFSLLGGILWMIWSRKEKKAEQALNEETALHSPASDPGEIVFHEFRLPKEHLTEDAAKRLHAVIRWTMLFALASAVLIIGILWITGSLEEPVQILAVLVFCLLISVPGILVQTVLSRSYERSVPSRIYLYPGKLAVDGTVFSASEIREIRISPERIYNRNSPAVFRELSIRTDSSAARYRIDWRSGASSGDAPFWPEYETFVQSLCDWGKQNRVPVTIVFMD